MSIEAVRIPILRKQLVEHLRTNGRAEWQQLADSGQTWNGKPATFWSGGIAALLARETDRLASAQLYHVAEDMTALAKHAATSLPDFRIQRADLPSDYGLVVFDPTIDEYVYPEDSRRSGFVVACCWGIVPAGVVAKGVSGIAVWAQLLRATWLLMAQSVAAHDHAIPDRNDRRKLARAGYDNPEVRVIRLRYSSSQKSDASVDRTYRHRWIVRGHWRQQWYSSVSDHRPVWIAPHVKGPDGAPLLTGDKVYDLVR